MNSKQTFTEFTTAPCKCHHCSLVFFFSFALFLCQTVVFSITSVFVLQAAVVPTLVSVISQRLAFAAVWWSTSSRIAFFWCASSNCFLRNSFLNWEFFKILEVPQRKKWVFLNSSPLSVLCVCVCVWRYHFMVPCTSEKTLLKHVDFLKHNFSVLRRVTYRRSRRWFIRHMTFLALFGEEEQ